MDVYKLMVGAVVLSLCVACGDDTDTDSTDDGSGASGSGAAGATGSGATGAQSAGGGDAGGQASGGTGGAVEGCAGPNGIMCAQGYECCEGVPYPPEGVCKRACDMVSDRAQKEALQCVDRTAVLERLAALPISEWSYKREGQTVRHIGPMAQDFREAFGLGNDETMIHVVDAQGVTIAGVQALYQHVQELERENATLRSDYRSLVDRLNRLERSRR